MCGEKNEIIRSLVAFGIGNICNFAIYMGNLFNTIMVGNNKYPRKPYSQLTLLVIADCQFIKTCLSLQKQEKIMHCMVTYACNFSLIHIKNVTSDKTCPMKHKTNFVHLERMTWPVFESLIHFLIS